MRSTAPPATSLSHILPSRKPVSSPTQFARPGGSSNAQSQLQQAADASAHTQQLKQLQAIADAGVPQLAGMEDEALLQGAGMEDEEPLQGAGMEDEELLQGKISSSVGPLQMEGAPAPNQTGMPDNLKAGIEGLSGMDMSGVRVHRNSPEPAKVGAHAFAQGTDIHLGSGQDRHLPHEAWHVVQQAQGRVQPTRQAKGVAINDDTGLETEADVMGAKALQQVTDITASKA